MADINQLVTEALGKGTGPEGAGGTDTCVCPECGETVPHKRGVPCNQVECPKCKVPMTGEGTPGSKV